MTWGTEMRAMACEVCGSAFLVGLNVTDLTCPNCFRDTLDPMPEGDAPEYASAPPEKIVPFQRDEIFVVGSAQNYTSPVPFRPKELEDAELLRARLRRIFLPIWLVDGDVEARWRGEEGTFYEVVSHREELSGGQWRTQQVTETRTRWEPRLGTLKRRYLNVIAPAVEHFDNIQGMLDKWNLREAKPYDDTHFQDAVVLIPTRPPDDAWKEAEIQFKRAAGKEVAKATGGDDFREFAWSPEFSSRHWTQLLVPVYTTYYRDDDGKRYVLYINGETGRTSGVRVASLARARPRIIIALITAVVIFGLSLVLGLVTVVLFPPAVIAALLGVIIAGVLVLVGVGPLFSVNRYNRSAEGVLPYISLRATQPPRREPAPTPQP